jgi:hypothetical protein
MELPRDLIVPTIRWYHQVTGQGAKVSINTYINNIIIMIYADLLTTSTAIIAKEIIRWQRIWIPTRMRNPFDTI